MSGTLGACGQFACVDAGMDMLAMLGMSGIGGVEGLEGATVGLGPSADKSSSSPSS